MLAIFKRELRSYFTSLWGYIYLAAFLGLCAFAFIACNLVNGLASMEPYFQSILTLIMFTLPILTMRIFAEDARQKTDQLLYTAPVSSLGIVLGKFFAVYAVFLIGLLITVLFPITLSFYGTVPAATTISLFVGFALFCGSILAIGMFMSSLTESQVIAAISSYAVIVGMVLISSLLLPNISSPFWSNVVSWLSITSQYNDFTIGVLSLKPILYYVSLMVIFVFLTHMTIQKRRFS